jgi:hypothetical protein
MISKQLEQLKSATYRWPDGESTVVLYGDLPPLDSEENSDESEHVKRHRDEGH